MNGSKSTTSHIGLKGEKTHSQISNFYTCTVTRNDTEEPIKQYNQLEPDARKLARPVLRGEGSSNGPDLPDTIADICTFPWVGCLDWGYGAREELKLDTDFPHVVAWHKRCSERPASVRGAKVCGFN